MKINPVRILFGVSLGLIGIHLIKKYKDNKKISEDAASFMFPDLEPAPISTNITVLYIQQNEAYNSGDMRRYMEISNAITKIKTGV